MQLVLRIGKYFTNHIDSVKKKGFFFYSPVLKKSRDDLLTFNRSFIKRCFAKIIIDLMKSWTQRLEFIRSDEFDGKLT